MVKKSYKRNNKDYSQDKKFQEAMAELTQSLNDNPAFVLATTSNISLPPIAQNKEDVMSGKFCLVSVNAFD